jgi:hypothetical protein
MTSRWSAEDLRLVHAAVELEITVRRDDGALRRWVPIWVVCADEQVYVRSWHRRDTGWFGQVLRSGRARIRVPGLEADVSVADVGEVSAAVTGAYRAKYGHGGAGSMITTAAAATTLRLDPS